MRYFFLLLFISFQMTIKADCFLNSFNFNHKENSDKQEVFFVRGVKLETIYHGIKLKVINNYKDNSINDTIMVWCSDGNSDRIEYAKNFGNGDTLICLLTYCDQESLLQGDIDDIPDDIEKSTDYMPVPCHFSLLKNNNDSVVGRISVISRDTAIAYNSFFDYLSTLVSAPFKSDVDIVSVFPNPTFDYLIFKRQPTSLLSLEVKILDSTGILADSFQLSTQQNSYHYGTNRLSKGMYLICFYNNGNLVYNRKIIKR